MSNLNALTADDIVDEHFAAAKEALDRAAATSSDSHGDRLVAVANAHIRLAELAARFRPMRPF